MDVVIFGHGAHARDMAATFTGKRDRVFFDDDDPSKVTVRGVKLRRNVRRLLGVNDPKLRNKLWLQQLNKYSHNGRWVHPSAHIGPEVVLGRHVHVNAGAFLTRCTLGDCSTVGPNATICGDVTIGREVMVGANATIKNLVTIGDGAVIGAGAIIADDVPPGVTMVSPKAVPLVSKSETMASAVMGSC